MYRQFAEVEERKVRTACGKVDDIDTNGHDAPVTLTYFTGRGRATIVRLMLVAAGIKYEEEFVKTKGDFDKLKSDGRLPFMELPLLNIDELELTQANAIVRYLARKANMDGDTPEDKARVNMYYDGTREFWLPFLVVVFRPEAEVLAGIKTKTLPKYLPAFEKILGQSTSAYVVGSSCTMADIGLLEPLLNVVEYFGDDALNDYPKLKEFHHHMINLEHIKTFLASPLRKGPNNEEYCKAVMIAVGLIK